MNRITLHKTCRPCEEDGMIVKEFVVVGEELRCDRCDTMVGTVEFFGDKLSEEPENYGRY